MITAFANQKGGVGKTTSGVCLAQGLGLYGYDVLLIDLDAQCNATQTLCGRGEFGGSSVELFLSEDDPHSLIVDGGLVDVIPSSDKMRTVAPRLASDANYGFQLRLSERVENIAQDYDFIIIDTAPGQDLVNMNAAVASDNIVIPLLPGQYEIDGVRQMFSMIDKAKRFNQSLEVLGILITMADHRTNMTKAAETKLRDELGDLVFSTVIPMNSKVRESAGKPMSLYHYAPDSVGAEAYALFTKEVIQRVQAA